LRAGVAVRSRRQVCARTEILKKAAALSPEGVAGHELPAGEAERAHIASPAVPGLGVTRWAAPGWTLPRAGRSPTSGCARSWAASSPTTESRPFPSPETGKIAVKVINHYGDEVMKVFSV
jgi:hypothetical protein